MNTNQIRSLQRAATATLLVGAGAVVGIGVLSEQPLTSNSSDAAQPAASATAVAVGNVASDSVELAAFEDVWSRKLRRPLVDPPPKPIQKPAPKPKFILPPKPELPEKTEPEKPKMNVRLLGTIIEPGKSMAIVQDDAGTTALVAEGDTMRLQPEGIRLDQIRSQMVTVSFHGETTELKLDAPKKGRNKDDKKRNRKLLVP